MSFGKFVQGLGSGMVLSAASVYIPETVPVGLVGGFGSLLNLGVTLGLSVYMFLSLLVPTDPAELASTQIWRYLLALPPVTALLVLLLFFTMFRQDSVSFCVKTNKCPEAQSTIQRMYKPLTESVHTDILQLYVDASQNEPTAVPSLKQVLTNPDYSTASYVGIYLAVANQLTGITAISVYALQIFAILDEHGLTMTPSTGAFLLGIAALMGSVVGFPVSVYFKFKSIFAFAFISMTVFSAGCVLSLIYQLPILMLASLFAYFLVFNATIGC
jgi:MFS family permease